jgi:hypothetical protein
VAEVLLFHHAQGQTPEFLALADSSLADFDAEAAALLEDSTLAFLQAAR